MYYVLVVLIFSKAANKKKLKIQTTAWLQIWNPLDQLVAGEGTFGSIFGVIIKSTSYVYCRQRNVIPLLQCDCMCVCAQAQKTCLSIICMQLVSIISIASRHTQTGMCKISCRIALFKCWIWRLTSQNYSLGLTPCHEHQQEQVYSSAVAKCRFAAVYSSLLSWI